MAAITARHPVVVELPPDLAALSPSPAPPSPAPRPVTITRRIAVVVPCYNRPTDAQAVLADLAAVERAWRHHSPDDATTGIDLRVVLVDNCSTRPLSDLPTPPGLALTHLRLATNTGGAGGYNAGMVRALDWARPDHPDWPSAHSSNSPPWPPDYLWLVDSDARVAPDTLPRLLEVLETRPDAIAAGSAIADPLTGQVFEIGGHVSRLHGHYEPRVLGGVGVVDLVPCDYLAACCALVRASAVRRAGVFPDRFLNGDDVEWFVRLSAASGGRCLGVPWSIAMHPRFDRFPTWTRYYTTRNAFGPLCAVDAGWRVRRRRAFREVLRAVQQDMMGRADLARLHVRGLADAAAARTTGIAPVSAGVAAVATTMPFTALAEALRAYGAPLRCARLLPNLLIAPEQQQTIIDQLAALDLRPLPDPAARRPRGLTAQLLLAALRATFARPFLPDLAIAPSRGRPDAWFAARTIVQVSIAGFVLRTPRVLPITAAALRTFLFGHLYAIGATIRSQCPPAARWSRRELPPSPDDLGRPLPRGISPAPSELGGAPLPVSVLILSYNRLATLTNTLTALRDAGAMAAPHEVIVADNGSTDDTRGTLARDFPDATLLPMTANLGVEAFNHAARRAASPLILLLDDDAAVEPWALRRAIDLLARRPDLAAVTFLPRSPRTGQAEWSFALDDTRFDDPGAPVPRRPVIRDLPCDDWPVMGCANLVRRDAFLAVGGYESAYHLYRNDTDLALKLLRARGTTPSHPTGVHFNPDWIVWHDSAAGPGQPKSTRWHHLATRNWIWTARRHAAPFGCALAVLLGWAWAHRLAGSSAARHLATLRGLLQGLFSSPPPLPAGLRSDTSPFTRLLRLHLSRKVRARRRPLLPTHPDAWREIP